MKFEWDENKNRQNLEKHGVSFEEAKRVFLDPKRKFYDDKKHSTKEEARKFCIGKVNGNIITVRFVMRNDVTRIYGAGYWRKGVKDYESI